MAEEKQETGYPSWRYGPGGAAQVFASSADVPEGWEDHPSAFAEDEASEIQQLRAAYKEKFDKRPGPSWDEAMLREKLAE